MAKTRDAGSDPNLSLLDYRNTPAEGVRIKPDRDSKRWAKATVDKEVDIRSYQVRTEDGRTYRRNRRHLRFTKQPFFRATPPESPNQQDQSVTEDDLPSCPVSIFANIEVLGGPTVKKSCSCGDDHQERQSGSQATKI